MQDAVVNFMRVRMLGQYLTNQPVARMGNSVPQLVPIDLYPCAPGGPNDYVYIFLTTERDVGRAAALHRPRRPGRRPALHRDPGSATSTATTIFEMIAGWTRPRDKCEVMHTLADAGVPCSAVFDTNDVINDPHLRAARHDRRRRASAAGRLTHARLSAAAVRLARRSASRAAAGRSDRRGARPLPGDERGRGRGVARQWRRINWAVDGGAVGEAREVKTPRPRREKDPRSAGPSLRRLHLRAFFAGHGVAASTGGPTRSTTTCDKRPAAPRCLRCRVAVSAERGGAEHRRRHDRSFASLGRRNVAESLIQKILPQPYRRAHR